MGTQYFMDFTMTKNNTFKMKSFYRLLTLFAFFFGMSQLSNAQSRTCLRQACYDVISFSSAPVIINGGAPGAIGTVYRFPVGAGAVGATPAIDLLVEIIAITGGAVVTNIDVDNAGLPRAFQPNIFYPNAGSGSVSFRITLVQVGTTIPVNSVCFFATPFDIDGGPTLQEFAELSLTDAFTRSAQTQISVTQVGTVIRGQNIDNLSAPVEPIDEDPRYTFSNYMKIEIHLCSQQENRDQHQLPLVFMPLF